MRVELLNRSLTQPRSTCTTDHCPLFISSAGDQELLPAARSSLDKLVTAHRKVHAGEAEGPLLEEVVGWDPTKVSARVCTPPQLLEGLWGTWQWIWQ